MKIALVAAVAAAFLLSDTALADDDKYQLLGPPIFVIDIQTGRLWKAISASGGKSGYVMVPVEYRDAAGRRSEVPLPPSPPPPSSSN